MHAFTIQIPTVVSNHEKSWNFYGFSREYRLRHHRRYSQVVRNIVIDKSNEKYFHQFSNSYFESRFFLDFIKKYNDFHRFCMHYHAVFAHNHQVCFKKHANFNEIEQKTWFKIGVGKVMKIIFIRNVPNNIPWSLKVSPVTLETIFPRKAMIFSRFFMFCDYCRDFYRNARIVTSLFRNAHF